MADGGTTYSVNHRFQIGIEENDEDEQESRYQAFCTGLTGCQVRARTKAEALRKIRRAIDAWLDLANRTLGDDVSSIIDLIEIRVQD